MSGSPHERLASYMEERRLELGERGLSWKEVANAAGISEPTLRAIRNGTNTPSALTQRGIERALNWENGSVALILDGGEPVSKDEPQRGRRNPMDEAEATLTDSERLAAELMESYRNLNPTEQQAVTDLAKALSRASTERSHDRPTGR